MRVARRRLVLTLLGTLPLWLSPVPGSSAAGDGRFQAALEAFSAGRNELAAGFLAEILSETPDHEPALRLMGFLAPEKKTALPDETPRLVSLELREADLRGALRMFAREYGFNLALGPDVTGAVTVSFRDVPAREALEIMLKTNGFGYEEHNGVIFVDSLEKITGRREERVHAIEEDLRRRADWLQQQDAAREAREAREEAGRPVQTEVFHLAHASAGDILEAVQSVLSGRGSAFVLQQTVPGGWEVGGVGTGTGELGRKTRVPTGPEELPSILVLNDTAPYLEKARALVEQLDAPPAQVLIEAMLVEVSSDAARELGIEWEAGWQSPDLPVGRSWGAGIGWVSDALTGGYDYEKGNRAVYARIRALEEERKARILSQPRILALHNQEAVIMVGERYPIMTTETRVVGDREVTTGALDRYEPIGISLRVIPRVTRAGRVNLLIHPEVTGLGENVTTANLTLPRIITREADTNVTVGDGEMVAIGGLLQEREGTSVSKVPLLGDIPLLGALFRRTETSTEQVDLLILITPRVVDGEQLSEITAGERRRFE